MVGRRWNVRPRLRVRKRDLVTLSFFLLEAALVLGVFATFVWYLYFTPVGEEFMRVTEGRGYSYLFEGELEPWAHYFFPFLLFTLVYVPAWVILHKVRPGILAFFIILLMFGVMLERGYYDGVIALLISWWGGLFMGCILNLRRMLTATRTFCATTSLAVLINLLILLKIVQDHGKVIPNSYFALLPWLVLGTLLVFGFFIFISGYGAYVEYKTGRDFLGDQ